ncbi:MAG: acetyltransferase [Candidatus Ozemobacter sibiricus]|jgi:acetyltransferase-like isoleucine patch superfamily enzyme|uniref:Acetyltransferase n=1 Tax=Candidatus Ozemobacter sibiricus TaxID=2268124 RepID=A0A367ZTF1_9BACT|nr:MAG: acetyltransferase [Candidatus Ozemobacter sibiricus]
MTLAAQRAAWAAWRAGPQDRPFHLERRPEWCVCDVLFPGRRHELWRALVGLGVFVAMWLPASTLRVMLLRWLGVRIGRGVYIAPGVLFDPLFPELIELENGVFLGMGCRLLTHEYTTTHLRIGRVKVGRGAVIGGWATIRSGVTLGARAMVGFHSFVNRDVPPDTTVVGTPARPLPPRTPAGSGKNCR